MDGKETFKNAVTAMYNAAQEAMRNASSDIDLARAQGEFATMAAQIAAIQKFRKK